MVVSCHFCREIIDILGVIAKQYITGNGMLEQNASFIFGQGITF